MMPKKDELSIQLDWQMRLDWRIAHPREEWRGRKQLSVDQPVSTIVEKRYKGEKPKGKVVG